MELSELSPCIRFAKSIHYIAESDEFICGFDYRIFCIESGSIAIRFDENKHFELTKDTAVLIPSGVAYKLENVSSEPTGILCLNFDTRKVDGTPCTSVHPIRLDEFTESMTFESEKLPELCEVRIVRNASKIRNAAAEICAEYLQSDKGYIEKSRAILLQVLIDFIRSERSGAGKEEALSYNVKSYIDEHYADPIDADFIAEHFHYHPFYVNRVFKKNCGTTVHRYIILKRIEGAKNLMLSTNLSIEKISSLCGFRTHSHFSQSFQSIEGMTPSAFRKSSERITL